MANYKIADQSKPQSNANPVSPQDITSSSSYKNKGNEQQQTQTTTSSSSYKNNGSQSSSSGYLHGSQSASSNYKTVPFYKTSISNSTPEKLKKKLPPYISATTGQLLELDYFEVEKCVHACGNNVPWTDFFAYLIEKGQTEKLNQLTRLFSECASPIAEEIIDCFLNQNLDSLKEIEVDVGGIAGGPKYLKNNIMFKFAIDWKEVYGGNEFAMKAAAQELRNINYLIGQNSLSRLFVVPCLSLITKCGLRVYATSLLPLGKDSLKYGCNNAGSQTPTIQKQDETMNKLFDILGQALNLNAHEVRGGNGVKIVGPIDIEGHIGTDGKHYIVDTARLIPPEQPYSDSNSVYYSFLRPEYLRVSEKALNSDVFSPFIGSDVGSKEDEKVVSKLSDRIYSEFIPKIAADISNWTTPEDVKSYLHKNFLSMRHLPHLVAYLLSQKKIDQSSKTFIYLVSEMFARVLKKTFHKEINETSSPLERKRKTISLFNNYFNENNKNSQPQLWFDSMKDFVSNGKITEQISKQLLSEKSELFKLISTSAIREKSFFRCLELCALNISNLPENAKVDDILEKFLNSENLQMQCKIRRVSIPALRSLDELFALEKEHVSLFGEQNSLSISTRLDLALSLETQKIPRFEESEAMYRKCLELKKKQIKDNEKSVEIATIEESLGFLLPMRGSYDKALESLQHAKTIWSKLVGEKHTKYAGILEKIATVYDAKGMFEESLEIYRQSKWIKEQTVGIESPTYGDTLAGMGWAYYRLGKFDQALIFFDECKQIREKTVGTNHVAYSSILRSIATVYDDIGRSEEALKMFEQCLEIESKVFGLENPSYSTILQSMAPVYLHLGRSDEALQVLEQSKAIDEKTLGKEHPYVATTISDIATILESSNRFEEAMKMYEQALNIQEKTIGKEHNEYATSLHNMGTLLQKMGQSEESLPIADKCIQIRLKSVGKGHPSYAQALRLKGVAFTNLKKFDEAMNVYKQILEIQAETSGKQSDQYCETLIQIAFVELSADQTEKALQTYSEVKKIKQQLLGKQSAEYATFLGTIGNTLFGSGKYEEAISIYEECKEIRKSISEPLYADSLTEIASVLLFNVKDPDRALPLFQECLKIREKTAGALSNEYSAALKGIALCFNNNGQLEECAKYYIQILKIQEQTIGIEDAKYIETLRTIGNLYEDVGNFKEGLRFYESALKLEEKIFGRESFEVGLSIQNTAAMRFRMGDFAKAVPLYRSALEILMKVTNGDETNQDLIECKSNVAIAEQELAKHSKK